MLAPVVSPAPMDPALICLVLAIAYFGFWLECRADASERLAEQDPTPSHDDLARRQGEIDAATHTRLQ